MLNRSLVKQTLKWVAVGSEAEIYLSTSDYQKNLKRFKTFTSLNAHFPMRHSTQQMKYNSTTSI
ncbi:hypothetical protein Ocin01_17623 [Orchesella cincta]|uniref:Uncharacterized protein n=1 Tax=Orchesella cincta TaxID=48709 RepID=A0A1D2M7W7_ORCCI|nr:hypothetical protein Ocin01_17623 [Orchesella cincta]